MRKLLLFLVLFPLGAAGQVFYQFNQPFPNATVRVCPVPSGGNPCPSPSAIFQDSGFTLPISQPVHVGPDGNFGFWTSAGQYTIQIGSPYNLTYIISIGGSGGGGGSGTVGTGVTGQVATYPSNGTSVVGENQVTLAQGGAGQSLASIPPHSFLGNNTGVTGAAGVVVPACGDLSNGAGGCSMSTTAGGDLSGTLPAVNVTSTHLASPLVAAQGGTGAGPLTAHGIIIAEGSAAFTALTPFGDSIPLWQSATVDPTVTSVPNCQDSGGNHLNYNTTTHLFTCGNTAASGSVNSATQFSAAYYSGTGLSTQISGSTPPTSPNGVPQFITEIPSGGAAVAPTFTLAGVPVNAQVGTTYTIAATDRTSVITQNNAAASTYTATNPTTAGFGSNFAYVIKNVGVGAVTENASGFSINGAASLLVPQNWTAFHWSDNSNYITSRLPDYAAFPNCTTANSALQFNNATGAFSCAAISGTALTLQTNGVNNISQTSLNLQNSAATNGVTLTATNGSAGNVQLGLSGTLNNAGLTNSSTTVNGQTCTLGSTCIVSGAENTQTASYTLTAGDLGRLVVMNCSAACTVTLFGSPNNGYYGAIESIGAVVPTVSLNTKTFNGSASVPILIGFVPMAFWSDGTNYFGDAPLVAGSDITLTPAASGLTISLTNISTTVNGKVCSLGATCSLVFSDVAPTPTRAGDIIYYNGTSWVSLAGNNTGTAFLQESSLGVPSWAAGSSTVGLNSVTAATGTNTINNGDNAQVWNWDLTTASKSAFTFGENVASTATGTPFLLNIQTLSGSTANPLVVTAGGTANGVKVDTTGSLTAIGAGKITATNETPAVASGNLMQAGTSGAFADSGVVGANVVTAASNYTASGNLVQAAGANKTTSDSGVVAANVVTAASNAGAANQVGVSAGANKALSFIDYPEVLIVPSANCNNTTAGAGWSIGSGGTVTCRAGTNNKGGFVSITDTSTTFAQFSLVLPEDWDTATNPYIRVQVASTDVTSGHTIIPQIQVSCSKGDGSTTDDVTFNGAHSLSTITLNTTASQFWSSANVQMNSTDMTGCVAGALMVVQIGRATDTATNAEFYSATVTIPRKLVVQAN